MATAVAVGEVQARNAAGDVQIQLRQIGLVTRVGVVSIVIGAAAAVGKMYVLSLDLCRKFFDCRQILDRAQRGETAVGIEILRFGSGARGETQLGTSVQGLLDAE